MLGILIALALQLEARQDLCRDLAIDLGSEAAAVDVRPDCRVLLDPDEAAYQRILRCAAHIEDFQSSLPADLSLEAEAARWPSFARSNEVSLRCTVGVAISYQDRVLRGHND